MITNLDLIAITIALAGSCIVMILQFNYIRKQKDSIYILQTLNKKLMHRERLEHKAEYERYHDYVEYIYGDYGK